MWPFHDAREALTKARATAPAVVGWKPGGWVVYPPQSGAPVGVTPEFIVLGIDGGFLPLSETGNAVLSSALAHPRAGFR